MIILSHSRKLLAILDHTGGDNKLQTGSSVNSTYKNAQQ